MFILHHHSEFIHSWPRVSPLLEYVDVCKYMRVCTLIPIFLGRAGTVPLNIKVVCNFHAGVALECDPTPHAEAFDVSHT